MDQQEFILRHISHYESELNESYSLLILLEKSAIAQHKKGDLLLEKTKKHIKYVCFFTSCFLDTAVCLKSLWNQETEWERKYYLKNGMLIIYETIKTYNKHQKEIRDLIDTDFKNFEPKFKAINDKLKEFKKFYDYDNLISKFRNKAGAHYDENFEEYFENLNTIDNPNSLKAIWLFSNFLMTLIDFWAQLIDEMNDRFHKK